MKSLKVFLLSFVLLFAVGTTAFAQEMPGVIQDEAVSAQDLGISEPKLLPDSPFYFLKNWARGIQKFFAFNPEKKAKLRLKFANEKLIEAKKLAEMKKKPKLVEKTLGGFQKEMEAVSKTDPEVLKKFSDKLTRQQILHQKLLEKLETQVPPDVYKKIEKQRERHIRRFAKVMEKIVPKDKIPDTLEKQLKKIKGSRFKEFKSLEFLDKMGENMPADVKTRIEKRKEEMAKKFAQKLDEMPDAQKEKFKDYLEKIPGNKLRHLKAISQLQGEDVSEKLRDMMEKAKEKKIEALKNEKISPDKAQESIERAKKEITTAEKIVATTSADEYGRRASRKLLKLAKKHLDKAKSAFEEKKYGMAFGLSEASYREALNSERIVKRINLIKKSSKMTCDEKCKSLGYDKGICRTWAISPEGLKKAGCKPEEKNIGYTSDCTLFITGKEMPIIGVGKACCCQKKESTPTRTEFYKGNFSVSDDPILNRTVELTFTLETIDNAPNTTIKVFLPEGIELINGSLTWNSDIKKGEKIEHKISIKVVKEGEWRIRAWIENEKFSGFNRAFFACLVSNKNSGKLLKSCPTSPSTKQPAQPSGRQSVEPIKPQPQP